MRLSVPLVLAMAPMAALVMGSRTGCGREDETTSSSEYSTHGTSMSLA